MRGSLLAAAIGPCVALLLLGGCTTRPLADAADIFHPARGACSRTSNLAGNGAAPGCARALREDQNYRPNPLDVFRYSRKRPAVPATVPEVR